MEEFDFDFALMEAEETMSSVIDAYKMNMAKISTGRANPQILDTVKVDYYGTLTPIAQMANVSVPEPRQLLITPYDRSVNKDIVSAINNASLGINAVDEGDKARISFPELTTERRRELVKSLGKYTEQAKVGVRKVRQDINKAIKGAEMPEDVERSMNDDVQKLTDRFVAVVDAETKAKEEDLMRI